MSGFLASGLSSLFSLWLKRKDQQALDVGVNYQKAKESGDALKQVQDKVAVDADVDRMSDDELRKSPYANQRD